MNIVLWIAQLLLAAIMVAAAGPKLFLPRARLVEKIPSSRRSRPGISR
jgi:hypothetical protein